MEFRIVYKGIIKGNSADKKHKHKLRIAFHYQIKEIWEYEPFLSLKEWLEPKNKCDYNILTNIGDITYAPLISEKSGLRAEIKILLLRPFPPGKIISNQADIDNQIKTLLDALKIPDKNHNISSENGEFNDNNLFCLLEDDNLVTSLSIKTDRLLNRYDDNNDNQSMAIVKVKIKSVKSTFANFGIVTGSLH